MSGVKNPFPDYVEPVDLIAIQALEHGIVMLKKESAALAPGRTTTIDFETIHRTQAFDKYIRSNPSFWISIPSLCLGR